MSIRCLALAACLLSLSACGVSRAEWQAQQKRLDDYEQQVARLNAQFGLGEDTMPGQAELWAQYQGLNQDFNQVRGQVEELTGSGMGGADLRQALERIDRLEAAVRRVSSALALDMPMLEGGAPGAQVRDARPAPTSVDIAKNLYDAGSKAFSDRRYEDAVRAFTDFINTYPKHGLISNAHFWRGESYYQMKNYSNAIVSYQEVIEKYPGSNKLQSAMFKQGAAMHMRGQKDAARVRLEELMRKYPKSAEAARAKQFLENMR